MSGDAEQSQTHRPTFQEKWTSRKERDRAAALEQAVLWMARTELQVMTVATTGLKGMPVEVVVLWVHPRAGGEDVAYHSLISTTEPMESEASCLHGVTLQDLVDAPGLPEVLQRLREVLTPGVVVFSVDFVQQTFRRAVVAHNRLHGDTLALLPDQEWQCAQQSFAPLYGTWRREEARWSPFRLTTALNGVQLDPAADRAGTAMGNAQRLKRLIQHVAGVTG